MNCPICNTHSKDLMYKQGIYQCTNCNHLFRTNAPDYKFYSDVDYWYKDPHLDLYQKMFHSFFSDFILPGQSIEFGAADGDFLYHVSQQYRHNTLVYNELVDILRPKYNPLIFKKYIGTFEDTVNTLILEEELFSNVFMIDVIEHLKQEIYSVISDLSTILTNGGRLFIVTNNGDAINSHNEMYYHQEHVNIFSNKSWNMLLQCTPELKTVIKWNSPQGLTFIVLEKQV